MSVLARRGMGASSTWRPIAHRAQPFGLLSRRLATLAQLGLCAPLHAFDLDAAWSEGLCGPLVFIEPPGAPDHGVDRSGTIWRSPSIAISKRRHSNVIVLSWSESLSRTRPGALKDANAFQEASTRPSIAQAMSERVRRMLIGPGKAAGRCKQTHSRCPRVGTTCHLSFLLGESCK